MIKEWAEIVKVTGAVGVVGLLFSLFMKHFFSEHITTLLGSDRTFYIVIALVCFFFICLLTAILKRQDSQATTQFPPKNAGIKKDISVTYRDSSIHNGDNHF